MGGGKRTDADAKKKLEHDAELAFWFHIDPRSLTKEERIGYLANLERCKAQQTIHLGKFEPTDHKAVYRLYFTAFGDEMLARQAQSKAAELFVENACGKRQ